MLGCKINFRVHDVAGMTRDVLEVHFLSAVPAQIPNQCWFSREYIRGTYRIDSEDPNPRDQALKIVCPFEYQNRKQSSIEDSNWTSAALLQELSATCSPAACGFIHGQECWSLKDTSLGGRDSRYLGVAGL